jgi:hypothetical protein
MMDERVWESASTLGSIFGARVWGWHVCFSLCIISGKGKGTKRTATAVVESSTLGPCADTRSYYQARKSMKMPCLTTVLMHKKLVKKVNIYLYS